MRRQPRSGRSAAGLGAGAMTASAQRPSGGGTAGAPTTGGAACRGDAADRGGTAGGGGGVGCRGGNAGRRGGGWGGAGGCGGAGLWATGGEAGDAVWGSVVPGPGGRAAVVPGWSGCR